MKHEKLLAKAFFYIELESVTPLSIGGSNNQLTDHDVLRNDDGTYYVPGTSIAGALTQYAKENHLFQLIADEKAMSHIIISDGIFENKIASTIRDGVKLEGHKHAKDSAKYDYEAVEKGSIWHFTLEITLRENEVLEKKASAKDVLEDYSKAVLAALNGIESGEIRFGYKKNRGFGVNRISKVYKQSFVDENLRDLLTFDIDKKANLCLLYDKNNSNNQISFTKETKKKTLSARVHLHGGISIKTYSTIPDSPDYSHISSNGIACIPGSSLGGLLRHQMTLILHEIKPDFESKSKSKSESYLEELFGNGAHASRIVIDECYFQNGEWMESTRTKIDDFSGSAYDKGLYTERIFVNGDTDLTIHFQPSVSDDYIGLVMLALMDLEKGYTAIGGSTSIGRGLLLGDGILFNGKSIDINNNPYTQALARKLNGGN